jgi:hypothetical protein
MNNEIQSPITLHEWYYDLSESANAEKKAKWEIYKAEGGVLSWKDWSDEIMKQRLRDLCEFLGKSEGTVYRWIRNAGHPDMANRKLIEKFTSVIIRYDDKIKPVKTNP